MKTGLRIRGSRGNKEVKDCVVLFAKWLRKKYEFPIRVSVYLLPEAKFTTINGEEAVASFRWFNKSEEPYIRLATGDYQVICRKIGKKGAIGFILYSLARQIIRYQNWYRTGKCTDYGIILKSDKMLEEYFKTVSK